MSYAGDLTPQEAWDKLEQGAILVDVRTEGEWAHIGIPDTKATENDPLFIQWTFPGGIPNPDFINDLSQQAPEDRSTELVFLCRSGQRSIAAAIAATQAGFTSYNVLEGFEGDPDRFGDRTVNGWKNRGLPTNLGKI
ncbi:rhodanese-related sulfurtransferase [Pseudarthrobacter oxydans]|uniref:Rhodanese-related sulfurtransferase n=1 Tax=Pseudarthrobacter oxydans TaxID=1671 RepID=A0AAW8NGJ8_PSEOX|nr:rhodanese-like domain-containing protein [Pseudarthrobacter oxydans]MDR6793798.1 rhodanese-related sulfurtransferase [Pseudarthrobacter oxydans]MDR7165143.1 rhodanese-related sulfurtransferase [Pseudarthrobacter oxydans]